LFSGLLRLNIPEFHGTCDGMHFAIEQIFSWEHSDAHQKMHFELNTPPDEIGLEFKGDMEVVEDGVCEWTATVVNYHDNEIKAGHHTLSLNTSGAPGLDDETGERTYLYTDHGWQSISTLLNGDSSPTLRVGGAYNGHTVIWKVIALRGPEKTPTIAVALDKGYGFASRHSDWVDGLVVGLGWGLLRPKQKKTVRGRLYFLDGGLQELQEYYNKDFR